MAASSSIAASYLAPTEQPAGLDIPATSSVGSLQPNLEGTGVKALAGCRLWTRSGYTLTADRNAWGGPVSIIG